MWQRPLIPAPYLVKPAFTVQLELKAHCGSYVQWRSLQPGSLHMGAFGISSVARNEPTRLDYKNPIMEPVKAYLAYLLF